jgi:Coenzyme PQQ synthesis protein D (PqqD)
VPADERYRVNYDDITSEVVGGEAVILNLTSGVYYSLDGAGGLAWAMLARGHTLDSTVAAVATWYGVQEPRVKEDVAALRDTLLDEGLLAVARDDAGARGQVEEHELPRHDEYRPPTLEKHTDMGDLLALDPPMPGLKEVPWQSPAE